MVLCDSAAGAGRVEVLQWARTNGYAFGVNSCARAAAGGHFHAIQWLVYLNGCPWDERTCTQAAVGGHLEIFQ